MSELSRSDKKTEIECVESVQFPDEAAHLDMINGKLDAALQEAHSDLERMDQEYMDAKRYMADYRGELDPHEMFQNELALRQIDHTGAFAAGVWEKLSKLKGSPYFARIDFQEEGRKMAEKYYIGRFTFNYENELLIYDWRSPVAGMFYDSESGPAGYDAPIGRIEGNLTRKRQFKIKDGELEYTLESAVNIQDDVLQRELSHTSDEKMKSIISTIQKEQNQIIRNENTGTILIQGVAGSGKTSIALHRIAFLLYRFKDRLKAGNITIFSPNKVFGDYISTVLPELGEEPIYGVSFTDIAAVQLEGVIAYEPDKDPLETNDAKWSERARFKSTLDFVEKMEAFLEELPHFIFEPQAYTFGRFTAEADFIQSRFLAYPSYPIKKRLQQTAEDIHDRFDTDNFMGDDIPRPGSILKSLNKMLKIKSSLALYKAFYQWIGQPGMLVFPAKQTLEWADVYPFLYLHASFEGLQQSKRIKHLVIDEMQDYTPIQYAVINHLFPCPKTILGDFGQFINPNHLNTIEDLRRQYSEASLVELTKSYRSTYEIITFAKQIQQTARLEPIERHGPAPQLIPCEDTRDEIRKIKKAIKTFQESGYASMGIILKTNKKAAAVHKQLSRDHKIHLISPESTSFTNGISITSIQMSKGLEFDEVIILDADSETYKTQYDKGLLYIAATRAMHQLTILYTGSPSPYLPKK